MRKRGGRIAFSNATSSNFARNFNLEMFLVFFIETPSCSKLSGKADATVRSIRIQ